MWKSKGHSRGKSFRGLGKMWKSQCFPQVGEKSLGKPLPCNMENGKSRRKLVRVKVEIHRALIGRMFVEIVIANRWPAEMRNVCLYAVSYPPRRAASCTKFSTVYLRYFPCFPLFPQFSHFLVESDEKLRSPDLSVDSIRSRILEC